MLVKKSRHSVHQLKKDSQEGLSQAKLSVLSLYLTELTQDHEEKEDGSKIMGNSTELLIQSISNVQSMYLGLKFFGVHQALFPEINVETNRKRFEAYNFLSIWLVKLDGAPQA